MALSKPVIATHYGGSKELAQDGKTGFIVNPFEIDVLAEKMNTLLNSDQLRSDMGDAGRKRIEEEFLLEEQTEKYIELL